MFTSKQLLILLSILINFFSNDGEITGLSYHSLKIEPISLCSTMCCVLEEFEDVILAVILAIEIDFLLAVRYGQSRKIKISNGTVCKHRPSYTFYRILIEG